MDQTVRRGNPAHTHLNCDNPAVHCSYQERDFDEFARHIRAAAPEDPLIFNCQLGGGRTTTGNSVAF